MAAPWKINMVAPPTIRTTTNFFDIVNTAGRMDIPAKINRLESDLEKTTDVAERIAKVQLLTEYVKLLQQQTPAPGILTHFS